MNCSSFNVHRSKETGLFALTFQPNTFPLAMAKPKHIGSILDGTLRALEIDVPLKTYSVWGAWKEIVGETVALHAQPRSIRNRILFVDVSDSTWIQQLQFLKPTLTEKINAHLGEPLIGEIRFKLGKVAPPSPAPPRTPRWQRETLDDETLGQIERLLQKIQDKELREGLRDVLAKSAKLERARKNRR